MQAHADDAAPGFRLGYVAGVTPTKWARIWQERQAVPLTLVQLEPAAAAAELVAGRLDAALTRPPLDRGTFSAITIYEEEPVVVVSRDHLFAALEAEETVTMADLADQTVWHPLDDVLFTEATPPGTTAADRPDTTAAAMELVAAGVGVLVVPKSLARLHHRKDVTHRSIADGPRAPVQLAWVTDRTTDEVEDLVGIVRGRTVNSSRGRRTEPDGGAPAAPRGGGREGGAGRQGPAGAGGRGGAGGQAGAGGRGGAGGQGGKSGQGGKNGQSGRSGQSGKGGRARGSASRRRGGSGRGRG